MKKFTASNGPLPLPPLHKATPHVLQVQKHAPAFDAFRKKKHWCQHDTFSVPPDEPNQQNAHSGISAANTPCSGLLGTKTKAAECAIRNH